VLVLAVISPPARYDTVLFSVHMWQHLLITMVAAPLILLGTPITLGLRVATPDVRRTVLLPILHSRVVRVITFPVVAWLLFAATMWGSHFSPLYNDSLENAWVHRFEHVLYLSAALMFWWQVIGLDPTPWRMAHPVRMLYVFLQMPQNSFLALAISNSDHVIYKHYETLQRTWGPTPLADQQLAGITMWIGGDLLFLGALAAVIYGWVKAEEMEAKRQDRALARRKADEIAARGA
jgi:putative copper resistance protein D